MIGLTGGDEIACRREENGKHGDEKADAEIS